MRRCSRLCRRGSVRPGHSLGLWLALAMTLPIMLGLPTVSHADASSKDVVERPRLEVDTRISAAHAKTWEVKRDGDFQAALDAAKPGDRIRLEAGAVFVGPFRLPNKTGKDWIVIQSSDGEAKEAPTAKYRWRRPGERPIEPVHGLPPAGYRAGPEHAASMPKLVAQGTPVLVAAPGAHHYRFVGIEIRPAQEEERARDSLLQAARRWLSLGEYDAARQTLVVLGNSARSPAQLPHHIIFDRCYLHGDPDAGTLRGIAMNASHAAVIDSTLADFKSDGYDSQAIVAWNGPGPFKIVNNYLEAAGENVMFGGGDPLIRDLVPADIEIEGNYFAKPLTWRIDDPSYAGQPWTVKNLFELKNARRVVVRGNLFEHNWAHAQSGFAILFTVRNQDGGAPWSVVEDIQFSDNVLRHIGGGISILGHDNNYPSRRTRAILIRNNLFDDVGPPWGRGQLFQLLDGTADVVIEQNTALQADSIIQADGRAHSGFRFTNNLVLHNEYGIIGTGTGVGRPSIDRYFPKAVIRNNIIVGAQAANYPRDNHFPGSLRAAGLSDTPASAYRLAADSPYRRAAPDDRPIGVDVDALATAMGAGWSEDILRMTDRRQR